MDRGKRNVKRPRFADEEVDVSIVRRKVCARPRGRCGPPLARACRGEKGGAGPPRCRTGADAVRARLLFQQRPGKHKAHEKPVRSVVRMSDEAGAFDGTEQISGLIAKGPKVVARQRKRAERVATLAGGGAPAGVDVGDELAEQRASVAAAPQMMDVDGVTREPPAQDLPGYARRHQGNRSPRPRLEPQIASVEKCSMDYLLLETPA